MSIRVLIVDDHAILRHSLSQSINCEEDMEVVGTVNEGHKAVELARELMPDVIIMDISMPDLNGMEATRVIQHQSPKTRVIALSMHSSKRYVREMFRSGAAGYLLKECDFDELIGAIREVARGRTYVTPAVAGVLLESCVEDETQVGRSAFSLLTQREREVLQLVDEGHSTKQVARRLYISPKTVEAHRLKIMSKLDLDNVAQLTKYAIQEGLTSVQPEPRPGNGQSPVGSRRSESPETAPTD
jgi:DNA-binding NarL/FixJ family response regulator